VEFHESRAASESATEIRQSKEIPDTGSGIGGEKMPLQKPLKQSHIGGERVSIIVRKNTRSHGVSKRIPDPIVPRKKCQISMCLERGCQISVLSAAQPWSVFTKGPGADTPSDPTELNVQRAAMARSA
jgi:hypothetical protein